MNKESWDYDAFVSYSRFEESAQGFVGQMVSLTGRHFRSLTGRALRLFVDEQEIAAASLWQEQIHQALQRSALMIAVVTPSYLTSDWCRREFDYFLSLELARCRDFKLESHYRLVFPLILQDLEAVEQHPAGMRRRLRQLDQRHPIDFRGLGHSSEAFETAAAKLARDLQAVLSRLQQSGARKPFALDASAPVSASGFPGNITLVTTRLGEDEESFVSALADAATATIVGVTNSNLAEYLEEALARKRAQYGPKVFWQSLQIVFLDDSLLSTVEDHLLHEFPSREEALLERKRRAGRGKRTVMSLLLREGVAGRWRMYTYPYSLRFAGALLGMSDGSKMVRLATPRPRGSEPETIYLEFPDRPDHYFESAFREIVEASVEEHEVVLVGRPGERAGEFRCKGARFRRGVMIDDQNIGEWLPAIVAITWAEVDGSPQPLLQVNAKSTSTREIGKISHLSGYINERDYLGVVDHSEGAPPGSEFVIDHKTALQAVCREMRVELDLDPSNCTIELEDTVRFYYPNKEHFLFYLFSAKISETAPLTPVMQTKWWTISELLAVREHQVLLNVEKLIEAEHLSHRQRSAAGQLVANNLTLHGRGGLAVELLNGISERVFPVGLRGTIESLVERSKFLLYSAGRELYVDGLAGLQYRVFFSHLLPVYARIGVPGTRDYLNALERDSRMVEAAENISRLYLNENYMMSFPIEV